MTSAVFTALCSAWQNSGLIIVDSTKKLEFAYAQIKYIVAEMIKPFISKKWNVQESIKHLLLSSKITVHVIYKVQ